MQISTWVSSQKLRLIPLLLEAAQPARAACRHRGAVPAVRAGNPGTLQFLLCVLPKAEERNVLQALRRRLRLMKTPMGAALSFLGQKLFASSTLINAKCENIFCAVLHFRRSCPVTCRATPACRLQNPLADSFLSTDRGRYLFWCKRRRRKRCHTLRRTLRRTGGTERRGRPPARTNRSKTCLLSRLSKAQVKAGSLRRRRRRQQGVGGALAYKRAAARPAHAEGMRARACNRQRSV